MSFFSKKQEVEIEPFYRLFYENVILSCIVDGIDINAKIFDTLENALVTTDSNFAYIDSQKFNDEIIALQFELFALAWLHQFGKKYAVAQSIFTKNYLHEKNRDDIWDAMEPYNQAIARSSTLGRTYRNAFDRVYHARVMKTRANLFDKYIDDAKKSGIDLDDKASIPILESIARPLNRLFTQDAWKKSVTAGLLLFAVCDRLGFEKDFEPSKETHHRWFIEINDFYEKDRGSLSKVKIKQ